MANWYPSTIAYRGDPDDFLSAIEDWTKRCSDFRATDLQFDQNQDGTTFACFDTAWGPDCCFARFLSSRLPLGRVTLDFVAILEERRLQVVYQSGHVVDVLSRNGHTTLRWSQATERFEEFLADYECSEDLEAWEMPIEILISVTSHPEFCEGRCQFEYAEM